MENLKHCQAAKTIRKKNPSSLNDEVRSSGITKLACEEQVQDMRKGACTSTILM